MIASTNTRVTMTRSTARSTACVDTSSLNIDCDGRDGTASAARCVSDSKSESSEGCDCGKRASSEIMIDR